VRPLTLPVILSASSSSAIALHLEYDFSRDRLIWDTGHQVYPHKLLTGRYRPVCRSADCRGGLMGYPSLQRERARPLHDRGTQVVPCSTASGLKAGDDLMGQSERHSVAVIGDGALPSVSCSRR
jgi:1-deoxy-D-xylulose-5-phosphate synthase